MPNSGAPGASGVDSVDWHSILAALDRSGAGRAADNGWGVTGPGPNSATHAANGVDHDLLTQLAHNLLQQQIYQGFSPEYIALLQQQLAAGGSVNTHPSQLQHLHQVQAHAHENPHPQQQQQHHGHAHQPQQRSRHATPHSSQPGSARGSNSGTPSGTPSNTPAQTPSHNTPIAPAPPTFSAAPSGAPTPNGRPPPLASAGPSAGPSTAAPTPGTADDSEDKRVRNTLASARFRAKKKAHVENIERNIRALETQHSELEVAVADLRKENGLLKEMVQLKYGGVKNG